MKTDFFSVLIRSWKILVLVIFGLVLLSAAAVFIVPAYQVKRIGSNPSTDLYLELETSYNAGTFIDSRTLDNYVNRILKDEILLYQSIKESGVSFFAGSSLSEEDYYSSLDVLKGHIKQNSVFFRYVKTRNGYLLILRVDDDFNPDRFGSSFIGNVNKMMYELLISHAGEIVLGFENSTLINYPEAVYDSRFARKYNRYLAAFNFMENDMPVLDYVRPPIVREGRELKQIIADGVTRKALVLSTYIVLAVIFVLYLRSGKESSDC